MDAIFSSTAREGLVRITENGNGAFVFCSDEVFQRQIDEAVDRALYSANVEGAIARGRAAYMRGDYVEGTDAAFAQAASRRSHCG